MSLKVLIILSLVAVASPGPAPTLFPLLPSHNLRSGGILNIGGSTLGSSISALFRGLNGDKRVARTSGLDAILRIKVKDFGGVCDLATRIVVSLSDTIEASIKGLGVLISRVVICILRIIICFLGNGGNNPVCSNSINGLVGVSTTASVDITALIKLYGLWNVQDQFYNIVRIHTGGRGLVACRYGLSVVFNLAQYWVDLLHGHITGVRLLTKADLSICFEKISIFLGLIGNTRNAGSGITILQNFIPVCNKYLVQAGFNEIENEEAIVAACNQGNNDIYSRWAISDVDISASTSLGGTLNLFFRGLNGATRLKANLLEDFATIGLRTVDDVFTLIIRIVLGVGGVLDAVISGLGTLLVRMVAGLLKITLCFVGKGNYGICRPGWDKIVGVDGVITSIDLVISSYGLTGCFDQINRYIDIGSNGKGIGGLSGSAKIQASSYVKLARIVDARKWESANVITVFTEVTNCLGSMGNSNSKDVGTALCNKLIPACDKLLSNAGFVGFSKAAVNVGVNIDQVYNDDQTFQYSAAVYNGANKPGAGFINIGAGVSVGGSGSVSGGGLIGGFIKGIFGTIKGVGVLAANALNTILDIKIRALNDVFFLIHNLSFVVQVSLDNLVIGLGSLFTRLVAVIIKIAVCVKGCPGDRGICNKEWNERWGLDGDSDTVAGLILLFKLGQARNEYNYYVNKCTNGKGIGYAKPSVRTVLEQINILIDIISNSDNITKESVTKTIVSLTIISGCIGNSRKTDSGKDLTQQVIPACSKYLTSAGYTDISVQISNIINECSKSNNDNVDWNGGYNTTPATGGGTSPPSGGDTSPPSGGDTSPPSGGDTSPPSVGHITPPSGGDTSPPSGGDTSPPSGGDTSPPSGGDTSPPSVGYTSPPSEGDTSPPSEGDTSPPSGGYTSPPSEGDTSPPSGGDTSPSTGGDTNSNNCGAVLAGGIRGIPGVTKFNINIIQELINIKIRTDVDVINLTCKITLALGGIIDLIVTGLGSILSRLVAVFFKILYCVKGYGSSRSICNKEWNALYGVNGEATTELDLIALFRLTNMKNECRTLIGSYKGQVTGVVKVIFDIMIRLSATFNTSISKDSYETVIISILTLFASVSNSYSKGTGTAIIRKTIPICGPYLVRQGFADISANVNFIVDASVVGDSDRVDWKALQVISSKEDQAIANVQDVFKGVKENKNVNLAPLTAVLNLEVPFNFDGVLSFSIKVAQALGGIIDVFITGLGSLFVRIVGCLVYYIVAVLGGARNANSFVSQKAYFAGFGVTVTGYAWADLITGFQLTDCQSVYSRILSDYTNGKGIGALKGSLKLFFNAIDALIAIVLKAEKILEAELSAIIRIVITLLGGFANSCRANLGNKIVEIFVSVCNSFLVKNSYQVIEVQAVTASINECNNVVAPWSTQITTTTVTN